MSDKNKIDITPAELERLVEGLFTHPVSEPEGSETAQDDDELFDELLAEAALDDDGDIEPSDEDTVAYMLDTLPGDDISRIERLLAESPALKEEFGRLRREAAAWRGEAGRARLQKLSTKLRLRSMPRTSAVARLKEELTALGTLFEQARIGAAVPLGAVMHTGITMVGNGQSADELVRWNVWRKDNELNIGLYSWALALDGVNVVVHVGPLRKPGSFSADPGDVEQIGVEVTLTKDERQTFDGVQDVPVSFELSAEDGAR